MRISTEDLLLLGARSVALVLVLSWLHACDIKAVCLFLEVDRVMWRSICPCICEH